MYPEDVLKSLFDAETCQYLQNKNRGGISGAKGSAYEAFFAVYQIARHARDYIEQGETVSFASQIPAFVDDLVITVDGQALLKHYQLKNSASVGWGSGRQSIADDFAKQQQLNQAIGKGTALSLVVPDANLHASLAAAMPAEIAAYSQVGLFPYEPTLWQVIAQLPEFREAITELSAFEEPSEDIIDSVAAILLGTWESCNRQRVTIEILLARAQQVQPSFIRTFGKAEPEIDAEVVTILSQISDFTYTLTKGFLHWQYGGGIDQGVLHYSCETEAFKRFQELIKKYAPTSFEELEGFLL